jgi:DNA-binding IclR family transcriptional regulator
LKLISLALKHLSDIDLVDLARPMLDQLANESGELVRLGLVDGGIVDLGFKAQGTRSGLRYDPDAGAEAKLVAPLRGWRG